MVQSYRARRPDLRPDPLTDELHHTLLATAPSAVASSFPRRQQGRGRTPDLARWIATAEAQRPVEDPDRRQVRHRHRSPRRLLEPEYGFPSRSLRDPPPPGPTGTNVAWLMQVAQRRARAPVSVEFEGMSGAIERIFGRLVNLSVSGC
jgi:hypothetical protein